MSTPAVTMIGAHPGQKLIVLAQDRRAGDKADRCRDIADLAEIDRPADRLQPEEEGEHRRRRSDLRRHQSGMRRARRRPRRAADQRPGEQHHGGAKWLPAASSIGPVSFGPVIGAINIAGRQADRDQQPDHHPEKFRRPARFAARHRHDHRADETDGNAGDAEQVRAAYTEQDRQHQRDHRREREHDAGIARTQMRDGGKHQRLGTHRRSPRRRRNSAARP